MPGKALTSIPASPLPMGKAELQRLAVGNLRNIIPVDEHLLADLRAWRRETPYAENGDYIFASPKMKGKQPLWLDTVIKKIIKPAATKSGIRLKGWHTLRHTYSALLKANGNDPKVVQELLRHAKRQPPWTDILRHSRPISAELTVE